MSYLLDTMIVSYFLQVRAETELAAAAMRIPCVIVGEVRDELAADRTRGQRFTSWLPRSNLSVVELEVGTEAEVLFSKLRAANVSTKHRGERASIALAATSDGHVFTTMDQQGIRIAMRELWKPGDRLLSLQGFLRRLVDGNALAGEVADRVLNNSTQAKPLWWADWRAPRRAST